MNAADVDTGANVDAWQGPFGICDRWEAVRCR